MATNIETDEEISNSPSNENDPIREAKELAENLNEPIASVNTCHPQLLRCQGKTKKDINFKSQLLAVG